jgi:hypothetical protein
MFNVFELIYSLSVFFVKVGLDQYTKDIRSHNFVRVQYLINLSFNQSLKGTGK